MKYDGKKFNPGFNKFPRPPAGDHNFVVHAAKSVFVRSGTEVLELFLDVDVGGDEPVCVVDRLNPARTALWKIYNFCQSTGLKFDDNEIRPEQCAKLKGRARFIHSEPDRAGRQTLIPEKYLAPGKSSPKKQVQK